MDALTGLAVRDSNRIDGDSTPSRCGGEGEGACGDPIYLDYNATTPIDPMVAEEMVPVLRAHFGNPSSAHALGRRAAAVVETARGRVARLLHCHADEVVFTSGGTESNNWALKAAVRAARLAASGTAPAGAGAAAAAAAAAASAVAHIVISAVEHPAVAAVVEHLRVEHGCDVSVVPVDTHGIVCPQHVIAALTPTTAIVSIMLANNEVGSLQPIAEIGAALKQHRAARSAAAGADGGGGDDLASEAVHLAAVAGSIAAVAGENAAAKAAAEAAATAAANAASAAAAGGGGGALFPYLHTDASQAVGKIPVDFAALGVDLLTVAAHKLYGPKGVGALIVRRGVHLPALLQGAGHEGGRRAGTESTVLLAGLGKACELAQVARTQLPVDFEHSQRMRSRLLHALAARLHLVPPIEVASGSGGEEGGVVNGGAACTAADVGDADGGGKVRFIVNGPCDPCKRLPNTLSVSFEGLHGPSLMARLLPLVACSAGAACHSSPSSDPISSSPTSSALCHPSSASSRASKQAAAASPSSASFKGSSVLEAMRVPARYGGCTVRLSVGRWTTEEEVDAAARIIADAVVALKEEQRQK